MELFRVTSRVLAGGSDRPGAAEMGHRLQAALLRGAAEAFGPRWRGPFHQGGDGEGLWPPPWSVGDYDTIATGPERLVIVAATDCDGAAQAIRAALYRAQEPDADFPPVLMAPDAEAVRSGALQAALQKLSERPVPVYAVDLLGVSGSAMPEAVRVVTAAIARERRVELPARWIVLLDPLYERRIGRWSDPGFFGPVRLARTSPIDGISLAIEIEEGSARLSLGAIGVLSSLYLGVLGYGGVRSGVDGLGKDVALVQRVLGEVLGGPCGSALVETERSVSLHPAVECLMRLAMDYRLGAIGRDEFVDGTLAALAELRREVPDEATPVAELIAAYAAAHPFEPVPVPDGAGFAETLGPPPAVQPLRSRERGPGGT
jgi:hypothetical protein